MNLQTADDVKAIIADHREALQDAIITGMDGESGVLIDNVCEAIVDAFKSVEQELLECLGLPQAATDVSADAETQQEYPVHVLETVEETCVIRVAASSPLEAAVVARQGYLNNRGNDEVVDVVSQAVTARDFAVIDGNASYVYTEEEVLEAEDAFKS